VLLGQFFGECLIALVVGFDDAEIRAVRRLQRLDLVIEGFDLVAMTSALSLENLKLIIECLSLRFYGYVSRERSITRAPR
jgi:hypothetical protein